MQTKHGALEGAILTTLWQLEDIGDEYNTVKAVWENLGAERRAYTTIKTVLDRLSSKKVIIRQRVKNRYMYKTARTQEKTIEDALLEIANKYCSGNIRKVEEVMYKLTQRK